MVSLFAGPKLHQRKREKKGECARLSLKWEQFHACLVWTDERVNLIWQHTTMSNDSKASHSLPYFCTISFSTFSLKRGLICCTASAAPCLFCLHCMRYSLLLTVCVRLGKHILGIATNPSQPSWWNVSPSRLCSAVVSGGRFPLPVFVGRFLAEGDKLPIGPVVWTYDPWATLPVPPQPRMAPLWALRHMHHVFLNNEKPGFCSQE